MSRRKNKDWLAGNRIGGVIVGAVDSGVVDCEF